MIAQGEDPEAKKFGQFVLGVLKDSTFSPSKNRAQSSLDMMSGE